MLAAQIQQLNLPEPLREHRFAAVAVGWNTNPEDAKANRGKPPLRTLLNRRGLRDWKFDFCWPDLSLALEIEGAIGRGRHTTPKGFREDCHKYNEAWMLGWSVLRVTGDMCKDGSAINLLIRAIEKRQRRTVACREFPPDERHHNWP
jgi:hypothetical protein